MAATFSRKGKRVVFLTADYAYGHEMVRGFQRAAQEVGAQVVGELKHPLGAADYSAFLPRMQALKPDVLVLYNFGRDNQISIKQAADFGMKKSIKFITPVLIYTSRLAGGAEAFDGIIGGTLVLLGHGRQHAERPSASTNVPQGQRRRVPSDYGALAYAAVQVAAAGGQGGGQHRDRKRGQHALRHAEVRLVQGRRSTTATATTSRCSRCWSSSSNSKDMRSNDDVFNVLQVEPAHESCCAPAHELGHK